MNLRKVTLVVGAVAALALIFGWKDGLFISKQDRQYYIQRGVIPATYVSAYLAYDVFKQTKCGYLAKSESGVEAALNDLSPYLQDREMKLARHRI